MTAATHVVGAEHLEQVTAAALHHEHVTIGALLHRGVAWDRGATEVALARIGGDLDLDATLMTAHLRVGNAVAAVAAEVRVNHLVAPEPGDPPDVAARARIDGCLGDVLVPGGLIRGGRRGGGPVEGRKDRTSADPRRLRRDGGGCRDAERQQRDQPGYRPEGSANPAKSHSLIIDGRSRILDVATIVGMRDRLAAWLVTGPVGRLVAFVADLAVALARGAINKVVRR
jgi:hypothetical protein